MLEKLGSKKAIYFRVGFWTVITTVVFIVSWLFSEGILGSWAANKVCDPLLGCTNDFFGFDALEHFLFGIAIIWVLVWFFQKFPHYSLLQKNNYWKNILIIIALVVLIALVWEFIECAYDVFRVEILQQHLFNVRLKINLLAQPTNLDTMGDFAFSLLGTLLSLSFVRIFFRDTLK